LWERFNRKQPLSELEERQDMKKTPLFEYEIPIYRKRPSDWDESKPTR
jgi:hypothetical protein